MGKRCEYPNHLKIWHASKPNSCIGSNANTMELKHQKYGDNISNPEFVCC